MPLATAKPTAKQTSESTSAPALSKLDGTIFSVDAITKPRISRETSA